MSDPKNHHWLPRSLLREWADGSTGKVMCFYRPYGRVVASRQGTRRIGATEGLYFVETSFMAKAIDTPAARLHRRMLNGEMDAFGFEERQLWVWFILLLLVRHPAMIRPKQEAQEESWKNFLNRPFVAGDHDYLSKTVELRERYRESLALDVMRHQCRQAREFVIGKDEGEEKNRTLASIAEQYLPARPSSL